MTAHSTEHPSRLYAHWLDGEWQRIAYPVTVEGRYLTLQSIVEGWLKLFALFGTQIVISDVQLTDSTIVVRLFADSEFREYLKADPRFLVLVAEPPKGMTPSGFSRAARGIHRACTQKGWTTSLPGISTDLIRRFGDSILSAGRIDARCLRDRSKGPGLVISTSLEHQALLEGILHGICHFARKTGGPSENPSTTPRPYTKLIEDMLNSRGLQRTPDVYEGLESVWDSVRKVWVPDESIRGARSPLLTALQAREPDRSKWPPEWHRIWNTVVHAWNSNNSDTVGATGESIAPLPDAVVAFRGKVSDIAAPFEERGGIIRPKRFGRYDVFRLCPSELDWLSVRDAVRRARYQRKEFQAALRKGNPEEIEETSSRLVEQLAGVLARRRRTAVPEWLWVPASLIGIVFHLPPVHVAETADHVQALVRSSMSRKLVLNTLHDFRRDLISGFTSRSELGTDAK